MRALLFAAFAFVFSAAGAFAHGGPEEFEEVHDFVESAPACADLTDDQLAQIGDYYMEQMNPGAAHESMDALMGGEGSETLRQMHILIARRWYCEDDFGMGMMQMMSVGMMGTQYDNDTLRVSGFGQNAAIAWALLAGGAGVLVGYALRGKK